MCSLSASRICSCSLLMSARACSRIASASSLAAFVISRSLSAASLCAAANISPFSCSILLRLASYCKRSSVALAMSFAALSSWFLIFSVRLRRKFCTGLYRMYDRAAAKIATFINCVMMPNNVCSSSPNRRPSGTAADSKEIAVKSKKKPPFLFAS